MPSDQEQLVSETRTRWTSSRRARKSRRKRRRQPFGISATIVFWAILLFGAATASLVTRSPELVLLSGSSIAIIGVAILVSDRWGFSSAKEMQRAYEPSRRFTKIQVVILLIVLMGNVLTTIRSLLYSVVN